MTDRRFAQSPSFCLPLFKLSRSPFVQYVEINFKDLGNSLSEVDSATQSCTSLLTCRQNTNVTCTLSFIFCLIRSKKTPFEKNKQTEQRTKERKEKKNKTSQEGQSGDLFDLVSPERFSQTMG